MKAENGDAFKWEKNLFTYTHTHTKVLAVEIFVCQCDEESKI